MAIGSNLEITFLTAKLGYTTIEVLGSSPASATPVLHWVSELIGIDDCDHW